MKKIFVLKGFLYSLISAAGFASLVIFVRLGYNNGLSTEEMLVYRFAAGLFFMLLFLLIYKPKVLKPSQSLIKKAFILGAFLYTAQSFCFFSSVKYVSPSVTELVLYIYPAFVTLLAAAVYKEKITTFKVLYMVVITAGFAFIFKDALHSKLKVAGIVLSIMSMVIYSVYLIVVQNFLKKENPFSLTFYTMLFAAASFFIIFGTPADTMTKNRILIIISLGLITTVIAIGFLFAAIELIGSSLTSVFSSFEPIITIFLSFAVLGIGMNGYQIIGAVLILLGVFAANIYHLTSGEGS